MIYNLSFSLKALRSSTSEPSTIRILLLFFQIFSLHTKLNEYHSVVFVYMLQTEQQIVAIIDTKAEAAVLIETN
jgi:hypothetical protein